MPHPFKPTHLWRLQLGSAGHDDCAVEILTQLANIARVRTVGGSTYLVNTSELTPIKKA